MSDNVVPRCCAACWHSSDRPCPDLVACLADGPHCHASDACSALVASRNRARRRETPARPVVFVGTGTCGLGAGAGKALAAVRAWLAAGAVEADLVEVGCIGLCVEEPLVDIQLPGRPRLSFARVTETVMIVWGGVDAINFLGTGGRYSPSTNSWISTAVTGAPIARQLHTAVWTNTEMIVWGGYGSSSYLNTGGRYNPSSNSWTTTSTTTLGAPGARYWHTAVWTGTQMIVWGGWNGTTYFNTGGRYSPSTNSWSATNITNVPTARARHTVVWTGTQMIVWGGVGITGNQYWNTGGRYNPSTNTWTPTSTTGAPSARIAHTARMDEHRDDRVGSEGCY